VELEQCYLICFSISGRDMPDIAEERYNSLLIVIESRDALFTLYLKVKTDFQVEIVLDLTPYIHSTV